MAEKSQTTFDILNSVNVNEHTEVKDTGKTKLTYLSWAWAWAEVKKRFPKASYEIIKFNGLPYVYDEKTGYMVYTTVTIDEITHEMWLPVMDGNNRAMLAHAYDVQTKYNKFTVQPATMFDINKTIMRCLTKNLAMFGLGLYIYAGEDLPETPEEEKVTEAKAPAQKATRKPATKAQPKAEPTPAPAPAEQQTETNRDRFRNFINFNKIPKEVYVNVLRNRHITEGSTDEEWGDALMDLMFGSTGEQA